MTPASFDVRRITHHRQLTRYSASLGEMLADYESTLLDDFTNSDAASCLLSNVRSTIPYLWLATETSKTSGNRVLAATSLGDEIPDWQAKLHGVCSNEILRTPLGRSVIDQTSLAAMSFAFDVLNLNKLIAQFDVDNRGARGYCLRMGFHREARLLAETRRHGQPVDQFRYVLFRDDFFKITKPGLEKLVKNYHVEKYHYEQGGSQTRPYGNTHV